MSNELDELDFEMFQESWEFLNRDDYIPLAKKVQKCVDAGFTPEVIRRRIMGTAGSHREPIAKRCELAAQYLYALKRQQA